MSILELQNVSKTYQSGSRKLTVLDQVTLSIQAGETLAIVGPSGSGKTTLLGLCAGSIPVPPDLWSSMENPLKS